MTTTTRSPEPTIGSLVTIADYKGRRLAARLTRRENGNSWVKIIGWPTTPYAVGDTLTVDDAQVIDWD